jgi:Virulence factor
VAEYQILFWRHIPSMVVVRGDGREVQGRLPQRYQDAIDDAAMLAGETSSDAYLEGWEWGPARERDGSPELVLAAVLAEVERSHPIASAPDAFQSQ